MCRSWHDSREDCKHAIDAGAAFIVSPVLNEEAVAYALDEGFSVIPGVYSTIEMMKVYELGAIAVKIFPAEPVGSKLVKYIHGPLGIS